MQLNNRVVSTTAAIALALGAVASHADIVELPASMDNTLYEHPSGLLSNGQGAFFFAGRNAQVSDSIRRSLLRFDVAGSIPSNATIRNVTLRLRMNRTNSGAQDVSLHRALADWGEGASDAAANEGGGAPSQPGDATWIHTFYDSEFWTTTGGDFLSQPSATTSVNAPGTYTWSSPGLADDVQAWVDGAAPNFGWVLVGEESIGGTAKRFASRQNPDGASRPLLVVEFDVPATIRAIDAVSGSITGGGIPALLASDDDFLEMQSQFGFSAQEPNIAELQVSAETTSTNPGRIDLSFEGRLDNPGGVATVRLFDFKSSSRELVATFPIGNVEQVNMISLSPAARFVRNIDGAIELRYRQAVIATFAASGFQMFHDVIQIMPSE